MIRITKKYFFSILFLALSLGSCDDDILNQTDPNRISTDSFWKNLDDTNSTLTATYATLFDHYILCLVEESWRSDMGWPGFGRPTPGDGQGRTYYYKTYTNSDNSIQKKWEGLYQGISRANQTISGLESLKGTVNEDEWTLQMAQARFFRGLFHFYLHTSFNEGNVILRDKVPVTQEDFNKGVSPSGEVLDFFRADLEYAYKNLPAKYENLSADQGRVTAGTAATILGTSFLYEEEYTKALDLFNDVIDNPEYGYRLVDPEVLFTIEGEFNSESIFEIPYNVIHRPELNQWDELSQTNRYGFLFSGVTTSMPAWIQYRYKTEPMDPLDERNYYVDAIEGRKLRNVPLRASQMVTLVEDEQTLYYLDDNVSENMKKGARGWGFGHSKKYSNHDHLKSEDDNPKGSWNSGKNVIVNRLAEVYLMRAECHIQMGNLSEALNDINTIRKRWGLQLLGPVKDGGHTFDGLMYTAQTLMDHLMYVEKPLELSNEGHSIRWADLRRWGIIKSNFDRLASEVYYAVPYNFTRLDGTKGWNDASVIMGPEPAEFELLVDFEYDLTAENYNPELHDYLPIPLSEVTSNSSID
ncbi:RagB/SusD family nutrient uptake outer membrane protein [Zobellia galactanivorans]|uniref:SusD/RagB family lipoprotein n=1 Tax=Zobellia galactanivorans (strain DSM 12802 / CCUG 47099 / CIP 106680 / NCIMB 13871 / Dsij) TaxID=63186 RepID=G0LBU4_ZOBGA|nr:RagB/SusD family nutrient uptake outer membrane protein [Zobellia galactanivorans]CAZ96461.1 SusD/RagB family lipoprotein [Zobellia galactanivorans]